MIDRRSHEVKVLSELARFYQTHRIYPAGNEHVLTGAKRTFEFIKAGGADVRITCLGATLAVNDIMVTDIQPSVKKLIDAFLQARWESLVFGPEIGPEGLIDVFNKIREGHTGPYTRLGFAGGVVGTESIKDVVDPLKTAYEGAGYLSMVPVIEEMLVEMKSAKNGSWQRAHDVVKMLSSYLLTGNDLFGAVAELKDYDEYTFTHALNVAMLSLSMARASNIPEHMLDQIAIGALCHDLGKKKVPLDVLRKKSSLTPEDRAVMDRHPIEGALKLISIPGDIPPLVPVIAFEHHMRADSSGYPRLPVPRPPHPASMIVMVADTFDAIRTIRPYHEKAFTQASSATILLEEAEIGRLNAYYVSLVIRMIKVITAGRWVKLSDNRRAQILAEGEEDVLKPLVETEDMEILDLTAPDSPRIVTILEE